MGRSDADKEKLASMKSADLFKSRIQSNKSNDEEFYETMLSFASRVLLGAFEKDDASKIEKEVNRLFRSNAYNVKARQRAEEERLEKYKALQEVPTVSDVNEPITKRMKHTDDLIARMMAKYSVPKVSDRQAYRNSSTEMRPLCSRLTALGAQQMRSPLVSMIFPSLKTKTEMLQERTRSNSPIRRVGGLKSTRNPAV